MEVGGCGGHGLGSLCGPLSVSLSLFLRLPYLWFQALDLSQQHVCVCVGVCVGVCVCSRPANTHGHVRGWGWGSPPGLPEACQGSPRWRLSYGFLEAECRRACGPGGGNPGLRRESEPQPPIGEGLGLRGPKSWDTAACKGCWLAGWPAGRQPMALSAG